MKTESTEKLAGPKRLALKKVTIVELSQEDLALVMGGTNKEVAISTSNIYCTGALCCAPQHTEFIS